jgi:hypothetical protein
MNKEKLLEDVIHDINCIREKNLNLPPITDLEKGDKSCYDCPIRNSVVKDLKVHPFNCSVSKSGTVSFDHWPYDEENFIEFSRYSNNFACFVDAFDAGNAFQEYYLRNYLRKGASPNCDTTKGN